MLNTELRSELFSIVDEIIRADRVLVTVVIDDAIVSIADPEKISEAQEILEKGDALVKQAAIEQGLDGKISLLQDAINQYRNAWEATVDLIE